MSERRRAVALGGGHGLSASLRALAGGPAEVTAIVTVADNGGSSGRLRGEFGVLPPGDLRMALAALCGEDEWGSTWAEVLQHRFAGDGEMRGHVTGNLLIVTLWEQLGDHVQALDWVGRLLGARGRVLPMALTPLDIAAQVAGLDPADPAAVSEVRGQVQVATTPGQILSIALEPEPVPCPEALAAVRDADLIVLGPGSWYTSVITHLTVPALRDALVAASGRIVVVVNLEPHKGETHGFAPEDHLRVLLQHAPGLRIHAVVAHDDGAAAHGPLTIECEALGARLVLADIGSDDGSPRHDPEKLAPILQGLLDEGSARDADVPTPGR